MLILVDNLPVLLLFQPVISLLLQLSYRAKRAAGHLRISDVIWIVKHTSPLKSRALLYYTVHVYAEAVCAFVGGDVCAYVCVRTCMRTICVYVRAHIRTFVLARVRTRVRAS